MDRQCRNIRLRNSRQLESGRDADYSGRLSITDRDRFDGATLRLTDDQWDAFFDVSVSGTSVTVSYDPTVADNRIASVEATGVTATSATLTATIAAIEVGAHPIVIVVR